MNMSLDCPFKTAQSIINELKDQGICNIVVDIHAESTAEKKALAYFLAEQSVTAVVGTHTHVQTADEQLLKNTAFITDLGMCGPFNGILGFTAEPIITKSIAGKPCRFEVASGLSMLNGVSIQFNPLNGHAIHIERILLKEH